MPALNPTCVRRQNKNIKKNEKTIYLKTRNIPVGRTHKGRDSSFAPGRIATGFRMTGPLHVRVVEYDVCEHFVSSQDHLKRVRLEYKDEQFIFFYKYYLHNHVQGRRNNGFL